MARTNGTRAPALPGAPQTEPTGLPATGDARADVMRRLQTGAIGIAAVLVLIGLASIIQERAAQSDRTAVAEAVATPQPSGSATVSDPLAQAGVLPEMPASPSASPAPSATSGTRAPARDAR